MKNIAEIWSRLLKKTSVVNRLFRRRSSAGRNPVTGLRIGDNFIEWTTLRDAKEGIEILAVNNAVLPGDVSPPPGTESREEQIKLYCSEISGSVSLGIAPDRMLMRVAELPTTDPAEMAKMIQLQVDAFSPFPDDRIIVSHEILSADEAGVRVLIAAVQKDLIEAAGSLLKKAGVNVQRIDAEAMAWWQLIAESAHLPDEGRYLFLILEPWGGMWLVVQRRMPLTFRAVGPAGDMPFDEFAREVACDAGALVLSLDSEHGSAPISGMEIWCRGVDAGVLSSALNEELQHEAKINSLDTIAPVSEGLARRFVGTSLSPALARVRNGQAALDLVPESWRSAVIAQRMRRQLLAATAGVLSVWLAAMAAFFGIYQYQHYRLARLEIKLNALHKPAEEVRIMQNQVRSFEQYLDRRNSALECLREISQYLPKDVLLTSFQFKKGKSLGIRGEALAVNAIYDYKQVLDKSQMFERIAMGSVQPGKRKATSVHTFQMTIQLKERP
ncbi:MAG: PilN domain-containing protein [Kiritimatiellia bacterium]|nr:PilN domain-containing protein [Kiritimatiellia bacterium]